MLTVEENARVMTIPNSAIGAKRDLHVGGTGSNRASAQTVLIGARADDAREGANRGFEIEENELRKFTVKVRDVFHSADDYVHDNPWTTVGLVALVGLTTGYFLSRRS